MKQLNKWRKTLPELTYVNLYAMIAQRPKLKPHIPQMMENIAADLGIELGRVNVKATTEEKLGFTGEGLGMSCHAVCLLEEM